MECCVSVSATVLPREGRSPLFAVESRVDGELFDARVVDPMEEPVGTEVASWTSRA